MRAAGEGQSPSPALRRAPLPQRDLATPFPPGSAISPQNRPRPAPGHASPARPPAGPQAAAARPPPRSLPGPPVTATARREHSHPSASSCRSSWSSERSAPRGEKKGRVVGDQHQLPSAERGPGPVFRPRLTPSCLGDSPSPPAAPEASAGVIC
nr:proline-rich receptor-like protein kinase PERK2 [Equus caballus]